MSTTCSLFPCFKRDRAAIWRLMLPQFIVVHEPIMDEGVLVGLQKKTESGGGKLRRLAGRSMGLTGKTGPIRSEDI